MIHTCIYSKRDKIMFRVLDMKKTTIVLTKQSSKAKSKRVFYAGNTPAGDEIGS